MTIEMRQQLKLSQQLIMTPQLQQAIKLLQLSRLELVEKVQEEMQENPVLEESYEAPPKPGDAPANPDEKESNVHQSPDDFSKVDWTRYLESRSVSEYYGGYESEERDDIDPVMSKPTSLADHLEWQLHMSDIEEELRDLAMIVILNLNEDGYLTTDIESLAEKQNVEPDEMLEALLLIQEYDPTGVGARDLRECLLLQVRAIPPENPYVRPIIDRHLENLVNKSYKLILTDLNITMEEVGEVLKYIECLEPKPGRPFGGMQPQYITPDIYVRKVGDEFVIEQNDDGLPKLRISSFYKNILYGKDHASREEKEYVQEKMRSALWLIRSIHQRQRTIYKVTDSIIKFQREFFEKGIADLRPMILRDVAEDIGMHESTISRVTTNKYIHTPHGIFELKFFFNSGLQSSNGESVASESVKNKIQNLVKVENHKKPYSDQEIVRILKRDHGITIARRTVTKYREMLGILSSTKRKNVF